MIGPSKTFLGKLLELRFIHSTCIASIAICHGINEFYFLLFGTLYILLSALDCERLNIDHPIEMHLLLVWLRYFYIPDATPYTLMSITSK